MKTRTVRAVTFCLLLTTADLAAQEKSARFAGDRTLAKAGSELGERRRIESMSIKATEIRELSADGKTLTVSSEIVTARGSRNPKTVFTT